MADFLICVMGEMITTIFGELLELFGSVYFKDGEKRKSDFKLLPAVSLIGSLISCFATLFLFGVEFSFEFPFYEKILIIVCILVGSFWIGVLLEFFSNKEIKQIKILKTFFSTMLKHLFCFIVFFIVGLLIYGVIKLIIFLSNLSTQ